MGKIYDANGIKMNVGGIVAEILEKTSDEQKKLLSSNISKYNFDNAQMKLAHGILDSYKEIDSTTENGMRIRKLLDNIMTKYQKSAQPSADDMQQYNFLITELAK